MPLRPRFGKADWGRSAIPALNWHFSATSGPKWQRRPAPVDHFCPQLAFTRGKGKCAAFGRVRRQLSGAAARSSHCHTSQTTVKQALQVFGADALPKLFETDGDSLRALLGSFTERGHHECTEATFPCGSLSRVEWPLRVVVLGCRPARLKGTTT